MQGGSSRKDKQGENNSSLKMRANASQDILIFLKKKEKMGKQLCMNEPNQYSTIICVIVIIYMWNYKT